MATLLQKSRRSIWFGWLLDNPLLVREMRRRMRGRLFSWSLIGYLITLGGVSCVLMFTSYPFDADNMPARDIIQTVGKIGSTLFKGMCFVEGVIALFIAPMLTAGLATAEKEKDTFDFLRVTTLTSRSFVAGCMLTTACFLGLVFCLTLPILGLTFIFGGVSMQEILSFNLMIFLAAGAISAWGIFNSTSYRRSRSVQSSIIILFVLGFLFAPRVPFLRGTFSLWFTGGISIFSSIALPGILILITLIFCAAAMRRLYEPNNRLFSYKQFTFFAVAALTLTGGRLAYEMSPWNTDPVDQEVIVSLLNVNFLVGGLLVAASIMIFSAGRIERGDEIWNLRLKYRTFQFFPETYLFYGLFVALWLAPTYVMGGLWDADDGFMPRFIDALPVCLLGVVAIWAVSVLVSAFSENRNVITIGVIALLSIVWGVVPMAGYFMSEINSSSDGWGGGITGDLAAILVDVSPIPILYRIWDGQTDLVFGRPLIALGLLIAAALLPLILSKSLRDRFKVSYDWVASRPDQSSAKTDGPRAEAAAG